MILALEKIALADLTQSVPSLDEVSCAFCTRILADMQQICTDSNRDHAGQKYPNKKPVTWRSLRIRGLYFKKSTSR
jgi:hypothetical protein